MTRLINDYIIEFPELIVDTKKISQEWIDNIKPQANERWKILKEIPNDPVLNAFVNNFDKKILHEYTPFIIVKLDPYQTYKIHVDNSRYAGINLIIRGNLENSHIDYYEKEDFTNPIFSYRYRNYPILMNGEKYHGVKNNYNEERLLFSIYVNEKYKFKQLQNILTHDFANYMFTTNIINEPTI